MRRVFIFVSLGAFIGTALWVAGTARSSRIAGVSTPVKSTLLDASGEPLAFFFEGMKPDPRFSPERLAAERTQRNSGATCGSGKGLGVLDSLFSIFVKTAQATEGWCSLTYCSGSYIRQSEGWQCDPPCEGKHETVESGDDWFMGAWITGPSCSPVGPDGRPCADLCNQEACPICGDKLPCNDTPECPAGYWCSGYLGGCCEQLDGGGGEGGGGCTTDNDCILKYGIDYICDRFFGTCEYAYADGPILIDIDGDGYSLTSAAQGVTFDLRANGNPMQFSWTAPGSDDGWLVLDRNGNGVIDNGAELFGNSTPQPPSDQGTNGFRALAVYDLSENGGNGDGVIDAKDAVFPRLLLWVDRNHNGISEPGELYTLSQVGITAIMLDYKASNWVDAYGNRFRFRTKILKDKRGPGADHWVYDVYLVHDSSR